MANPKAECRLEPINIAYLDDLAKLGAYGKGRAGVIQRFILDGITSAIEKGVIRKRSVEEFDDAGDDASETEV